ncbi:MAG: NHLP family bacteriocin export ABC transporter peptidase/permease/ATPase subunit [bacterium]|nr:NHLP family bacteriocin export ABC transporter peptidase/permease/ATPase subunit [Spirochaetales bacterium]MDT3389268.1 NHLP family bacteriocin export ABC transporter peptidase/permease/ATPase subunit [bacterium]
MKVADVPVIMQMEALECGAASLAMVMAYYGKWVPLEQVRSDCGVSRDGSNAKNIYMAAQHYGMEVRARRMSPEQIREEGFCPCIVHWDMNHFVVVKGFRGNSVYINDPARGSLKISWKEFDESFTGIVLFATPSKDFVPEGGPKSVLKFARKSLSGAGAALVFVALTTIIFYLFGIINSVTSRIFIDRILSGYNEDWMYPFVLVLSGLAVIELVVVWVRAIYQLKLNGKMTIVGGTSYMWKVLHLPMEFFSQRMAGDIQMRIGMSEGIATTLVETLAPVVLDTVMMILYLVLMIRYSLILTAIGVGSVLVNIFLAQLISRKRVNMTRVRLRDAAMLESTTVNGISMIETIKSSGAENGYFQRWAGFQASLNNIDSRMTRTFNLLGLVPQALEKLTQYAVLVLGVWLVLEGQFTLGTVVMFQGFVSSFMSPAMTLIGAGQTIQEMRTQMERMEDVMEYPDDPNVLDNPAIEESTITKLHGDVELRNVTFGYSKLAEPVIKDLSLRLEPGKKIALVGSSGCGKSTIAKLITGLYNPWSGDILFDGKPRSAYPHDMMVGSIAVIDQDITLFEGSVADNIKMWDSTILDFEMIMAAVDARIHDDIVRMPGGYQHMLASGGRELSGGQRQRMEIARALALDPSVLILDEGTSALDAKTEYEVINAISERGISCIFVAHRLSTVRDCDEIIVLDRGEVVERGTHAELMEKAGLYHDLVKNE